MLLQSVYAIIDLGFVGRLGETSVAGLSISFQVFFIVLALSQILATTALATVSQAYGAGRVEEARGRFSAFVVIGLGVGCLTGLVALATAEQYISTYTDDPATHAEALRYYRVNCITFVTQMQLIILGNGMRGSGDFVTPMRIMAASVVLNMILDPLLIFGLGPFPRLEIAGAAWATVISQGFGLVVYAKTLTRPGDERSLTWVRPVWRRDLYRLVFERGAPAGVQFFLLSALLGIILGAMREHGPIWTATAGGGFRIVQQSILPMVAISSAAAAIAGQNYGAHKHERVREASWTAVRWALAYGTTVCVLLFVGGRWLGLLFLDGDDLYPAEVYFQWSAPLTIAFAMAFIPTFVMQALGRAVLPMSAAVVRLVLLAVIVFGVLDPRGLGPAWVFAAATGTAFVEGALDLVLLARELRLRCPKGGGAEPLEKPAPSRRSG